jgi:hypothetical protein
MKQGKRQNERCKDWLYRLGWMIAIWLGGVAALGAVALILRLAMHAAGMHTR